MLAQPHLALDLSNLVHGHHLQRVRRGLGGRRCVAKARVQHQVRTAAHLRQDLVLQRGVARQAGRRVSTDTGNEGRVFGDVWQRSAVPPTS